MDNIVVAIPNDEELASFIGKKGSVNSITFYNRKSDITIVALTPTNMDDKFYAMAQAMLVSDLIIISTRNIDRNFGEALIAASLLQKKTFFTDENDVSSYIAKAGMKDTKTVSRTAVLEEIAAFTKQMQSDNSGPVRVDIDKAFPVKGIGTVLLGIVRGGTAKKHAKLSHNSGKMVEVRSIQSHDEDVDEAGYGARVGLAVKGIESEEVEKGDILSDKALAKAKSINASLTFSALAKKPDGDAFSALFVCGFSSVIAKISKEEEKYKIEFEKPIALEKNDKFFLIGKEKPRVFAIGIYI